MQLIMMKLSMQGEQKDSNLLILKNIKEHVLCLWKQFCHVQHAPQPNEHGCVYAQIFLH